MVSSDLWIEDQNLGIWVSICKHRIVVELSKSNQIEISGKKLRNT